MIWVSRSLGSTVSDIPLNRRLFLRDLSSRSVTLSDKPSSSVCVLFWESAKSLWASANSPILSSVCSAIAQVSDLFSEVVR
ncbi:hypothetical protein XELAEV_18031389mg [Xenopus laevis]|uniref:Uncharacterized protein n=1 Tax=Xenopus laevis TaxID=8355 RepID=A0A974CMN0_XENLA|nr:hypothetical protein XELAEV_18031389mg [Xenopus laevis]